MQELATDKECIEEQKVRLSPLSQQGRDLPVVQLVVVAGCVMCGTIGARRQECRQICALRPDTERHITNEEHLAERLQDTCRQETARPGLTMRGSVVEEERVAMMGTPEEVATLEALEASPDDPHRGHTRLVRRYLRVRVTAHSLERVATRAQRQEGTP